MILSHRHKFIFLKTKKTAGTSIEVFLSGLCGPDDIVTPLSREDEALRSPDARRNYKPCDDPLDWRALRDRAPGAIGRLIRHWGRSREYTGHMTGAEVRRRVGETVWRDYFKFAFERNPWDKHLSYFHFRSRDERMPGISFRDFVVNHPKRAKGWEIYAVDDRIAVDFIGRYETLEADLGAVLQRLGIDAPVALPHAKGRYRADKSHYRSSYDDEMREAVAALYAREIAAFGYEF